MTAASIPVHVYGRVSYIDNKTHPNRKEDKSLIIQRQEFDNALETIIPDLFGGRKGEIVGSYSDEGKSASRKRVKRQDFIRLLKDIENGQVKVLMVLNLSRFARLHHKDAMRLHLMLDDFKVSLISIDDRKIINIDELMGFIEVAFKSNTDHEYARTVGKNTLRGCLHSISQGNAHTNYIPYGMMKVYTTEKGDEIFCKRGERVSKGDEWRVDLIPGDAIEQDVVKWLFSQYATRDISKASLAHELNKHENAIVRLGPAGKGWCEETIGWMLQNLHYNAKVFFGQRSNGEFYRTNISSVEDAKKVNKPAPLVKASSREPLIDDETFEKVQRRLENNRLKNHKPQPSKNGEGHCLTGVLFCRKCGRAMQYFNPKNPRYQCKGSRTGCSYWSVGESEMMTFIMKKIDVELLRQLDDKPIMPATNHRSKIEEIDHRIKSMEATMKTAAIETIPTIVKTIDDLNQQRAELAKEKGEDNYHARVLAAHDRWELMVQPYLVGIKTGNLGEGDEAVQHLGIADEIDRLFNFTYARPSAIRQLLHDLDARVELSFKPVHPNADGSAVKRGKWAVDSGSISCTIEGNHRTTVSSLSC